MLTKLQFRPGIQKEVTAYANEGGWIACDKIRFRQGFPEKIGGWQQLSTSTFLGTCRSLTEWTSLGGAKYKGVGTNLKYYAERGGEYYDITPIRATAAAGSVTFSATTGSATLTVNDTAHGAVEGDFVTFSGAVSLGGDITAALLNANHRITSVPTIDSFTVELSVAATALDVGNGGSSVSAVYEISPGGATPTPTFGWGSGPWSNGTWGAGSGSSVVFLQPIRIWSHAAYGEDLIYGPRGRGIYYWSSGAGLSSRGTLVTGNDTPTVQNNLMVSDTSRFVIALGCNDIGSAALDPMLVRWSDQEQYNNWTPAITNQAGGLRLSSGSFIVTGKQTRQEILIWTDSALYSMQYQGPPYVWSFQILGDNLSIASRGAAAVAAGVTYWMGTDKFYKYDGRIQPLRCDVQRHVFGNIEETQLDQVTCGSVEQFSEIWWFYPSAGSEINDKYVVYNYGQDIWYYGNLSRTAWIDSVTEGRPVGATGNRLVVHEFGVDNLETGTPQPIESFITSAPADIADGDKFAFVRRMLPDVTFDGSSATNPSVTMELIPLNGSGSGYTNPASVGGDSEQPVVRSAVVPVEQFTNQVNVRVRGRQIAMKIRSDAIGVKWQLGSPRVDTQIDGHRG
jgi:hypothetical protein